MCKFVTEKKKKEKKEDKTHFYYFRLWYIKINKYQKRKKRKTFIEKIQKKEGEIKGHVAGKTKGRGGIKKNKKIK